MISFLKGRLNSDQDQANYFDVGEQLSQQRYSSVCQCGDVICSPE